MAGDQKFKLSVLDAKKRYVDRLMAYPNVCGVGVGYRVVRGQRTSDVCIRVYVKQKVPEHQLSPSDILPRLLDGVLVDVIEAEFQTHFGGPNLTPSERQRKHPIALVGGLSVGGLGVSAGTLGASVFDRGGGRQLLLSNWHVLCGRPDCQSGEAIVQPGVFDGGTPSDIVARLFRAALTVHVDAAVAEVTGDRYLIDWISGIGTIDTVGQATLGMRVKKSGRTTGLTIGTVSDISADVTVGGYPGGEQSFRDQIIADSIDSSPVSLGGDSGSLVVNDDNNRAIGLLFAGPRVGGAYFIANPIDEVLASLRIEIRRDFTILKSDSVHIST